MKRVAYQIGQWVTFNFLLVILAFAVHAQPMQADRVHILELLEAEKFTELNKQLSLFQSGYEKGNNSDRLVAGAFYSFSNSDPALKDKLNKWVDQNPKSYAALLARGVYYINLGFLSRGLRFRDKTSDQQIQAMAHYFQVAEADLEKSLTLNAKLTVAYRQLFRIAMNTKDRESVQALFKRGISVDPASYELWYGYLFCLQRKWGGEKDDMAFAILKMQKQYKKNPALKELAGFVPYEYADWLETNKKDKAALEYYDSAADLEGLEWAVQARGRLHYYMENYELALKDFNRVIKNGTSLQYADAIRWRGKVYWAQAKPEKALKDFNLAIRLDKLEPDYLRDRGGLYLERKEYPLALSDYNDALVYGHNNAVNWYNRGWLYMYKFKDYKKALPDLKRATAMKPKRTSYWYAYASAQHHLRDCEITGSLKKYLELCTNKKCADEKVRWAKATMEDLIKRGICPASN